MAKNKSQLATKHEICKILSGWLWEKNFKNDCQKQQINKVRITCPLTLIERHCQFSTFPMLSSFMEKMPLSFIFS